MTTSYPGQPASGSAGSISFTPRAFGRDAAVATGGTGGPAVARLAGAATSLLVAGIGEMIVTSDTSATLVAYGLGSCVALTAWDAQGHVGGLAHFMLPAGASSTPPVKFIEGGLSRFIAAFTAAGGQVDRAQLKAAGGSAMLAAISGSLDIGRRNAEALDAGLKAAGLRVHASDLGGSAGRTVQLSVADGRLLVKSVTATSVL